MILPIKKKWFDMILSGEKKEEYREIKDYYFSRFQRLFNIKYNAQHTKILGKKKNNLQTIIFRNGYSKNSREIETSCSLRIENGKEEWGAEKGKEYFILEIFDVKKRVKYCENCKYCIEKTNGNKNLCKRRLTFMPKKSYCCKYEPKE